MIRKCVLSFRVALIALGISSVSIFFLPLIKGQALLQNILACAFWVSLVVELIFLAIANSLRKKIEKVGPHMKQKKGFGKLGIFCFVQNPEAAVSDVLLLVSALFITAVVVLKIDSMWLMLIGILAVYLLFHMHCILNGILYKSIKHYQAVIHKRRDQT